MTQYGLDPHRAKRELLSGSQLLADLPAAVLEPLVVSGRIVHLQANQTLFKSSDPIREAFILFSGSVQRSMLLPSGENKLIELIQSEQIISLGELFALTSHTASCTAISRSLLVAIDIRALQTAISKSHELSYRIITALAKQQCAIEFDVTGFHHGLTGAQRLLDYLLELAGDRVGIAGETTVQFNASKRVIAARLGMSPESLSRHLRDLSELGTIMVEGRNVHIQNAALQDTMSDAKERLKFRRKPKGHVQHRQALLPPGAIVNTAGRLRVLSQRMAVANSLLRRDIEPHRTRIRLRQLEKAFNDCLAQLLRWPLSDEVRADLAAIEALWPEYQAAVYDETPSPGMATQVFVLSERMFDITDRLTASCARNTGTPLAAYVNQSGRNRVLSQRITKFFLNQDDVAIQPQIAALMPAACSEFETNLRELAESAGEHPELVAQLKVVAAQWQKFVASLDPELLQGGPAKHARKVLIESERLLRCVETMVKLFERLTAKPADIPGED